MANSIASAKFKSVVNFQPLSFLPKTFTISLAGTENCLIGSNGLGGGLQRARSESELYDGLLTIVVQKQRQCDFKKDAPNCITTINSVTKPISSSSTSINKRNSSGLLKFHSIPCLTTMCGVGGCLKRDVSESVIYERARSTTETKHSSNSQEQQHPSPTQQIAPDASAPLQAADGPRVELSKYTNIGSIEQICQYSSKFDQNYDEYLIILAQLKSDLQNCRKLTARFHQLQQESPEYYNSMHQFGRECAIFEERFNRGKRRLEYMQEKLDHIRQLMEDYDDNQASSITSHVQLQPQNTHQQTSTSVVQQQQQQLSYHYNAGSKAHLSPMLEGSGERYHSPLLLILNTKSATKGMTEILTNQHKSSNDDSDSDNDSWLPWSPNDENSDDDDSYVFDDDDKSLDDSNDVNDDDNDGHSQ